MHVVLISVLLPTEVVPEENATIALPEKLTVDFEVLTPPSKPAPLLAAKPAVKLIQQPETPRKVIREKPKPTPTKAISKKVAPSPPSQEQKPAEVNSIESQAATKEVADNQTTKNKPVADKKTLQAQTREIRQDKSETSIIHNPAYQRQRPIKYPRSAMRKKLQGTVTLRANIDIQGRVIKTWVHQSSGHPTLDRSAMKSVKAWVFKPAQKDGSPIASTVQFPVAFQLK